MVSFELRKEKEKDVFRLVTSVAEISKRRVYFKCKLSVIR